MIAIPPGGRIAVVDDDDLDRMIIKRVVGLCELENPIVEFPSGASFIDHLVGANGVAATEFSLVLLDINMPGMTGFEALVHVRTELGLVDLPIVVMLTSSDAKSDIRRAEELGADAYLAKQSGVDKFVALFNETFTNDEAA